MWKSKDNSNKLYRKIGVLAGICLHSYYMYIELVVKILKTNRKTMNVIYFQYYFAACISLLF